jgi:class 3 adenylate cyclase
MFTDLVGSTGLLREGPEVADDVQHAHLASSRDAVGRYRGVVVKSVGDGVMAVFPSASDAIACAELIQQTAEHARRRNSHVPLLRVGLSAGEAVYDEEHGDWFGRPVVEAARLCTGDASPGDQVLVTGVVRLLVGGAGGHTFLALGTRELKGFDEPVDVFELAWRRSPAAPMPLPAPTTRATSATSANFVGRTAELQRLDALSADAHTAREPRVVLVGGEPGIGKTRIVAELARRAHEGGTVVLWGGCDEEVAVSYRPFVDALRYWFDHVRDPEALAVLTRTDVLRLIPELRERFPDLPEPRENEPDLERLQLFEHVTQILDAAAAANPTLLVLDDLHWATTPTILMLRHLVRHLGAPLVIVGTYRDTELDRQHPLAAALADLRREPIVERIDLRGLDQFSVTEYVTRVLTRANGHADALATLLQTETRGNPFFIGQVLRHLIERGDVISRDGQWLMATGPSELGLPEGVREVIARRLSRLPDNANRALAVAAVIGMQFDHAVLDRVVAADAGGDVLIDGLEAAVRARLIDEVAAPVPRYGFAHALVRQTLLSELTAARRSLLHRQVGDALAYGPEPDVAALAYHYCAGAAAGAIDDALRWSTRAVETAFEHLAFEEALATLERLLTVLELERVPDPRKLAMVRLALGRARQSLGDTSGAKQEAALAADAARAAGEPLLLAEAAAGYVSWGMAGTPDETSASLLSEALAAVGEEHLAHRAILIAQTAFYRAVYESLGAAADPQAAEAVELARRSGDPVVLRETLAIRALVLMGEPDLELQRSIVAELELYEGDLTSVARRVMLGVERLRQRVVIDLQSGDADASRAAAREFASLPSVESSGLAGFHTMWTGMFLLMAGELEDAEQTIDELGRNADINFINSWAAQLFTLRLEQGRLAELTPVLDAAIEATPGLVALQTARARTDLSAGKLGRARAALRRLTADDLAIIPHDTTWSTSLANLAELATALDDQAAAAALFPHLLCYEHQLIVVAWGVTCPGAADRYLAMLDMTLGRYEDAAQRFAVALGLEERAGAPALATRTRLWWARLLLARHPSDPDAAGELLEVARSTANRLGQLGLAAEIEELHSG